MSITILILLVTIVTSLYFIQKPNEMHKVLFNPYTIKRNNKWELFITHAFVHADYMHLGVNMYVFYNFGSIVEEMLGPLNFILLYLGGVIFASTPSFLKHQNNLSYNSLGASGAVASVLFSFILMAPDSTLGLMFIIPLPAYLFGVLYLVYEAYMDKKSNDRVAHDAHFYGALWGLLMTGVTYPNYFYTFFDKIF